MTGPSFASLGGKKNNNTQHIEVVYFLIKRFCFASAFIFLRQLQIRANASFHYHYLSVHLSGGSPDNKGLQRAWPAHTSSSSDSFKRISTGGVGREGKGEEVSAWLLGGGEAKGFEEMSGTT